MTKIAIIGGGIGGLATAFRIHEQMLAAGKPAKITIYDASDRFGGVIASSQRDGFTLEHGPDSIIRTKPAGLQLIKDLRLEDQLQPTQEHARSSLIAKGRKLIPVPDGLYLLAPGKFWPFISSPIMSPLGKLRMALDLVLPRRSCEADEESLADFVRRRLGREALERIAQPMISGIYTADPEQLSLRATMPQFIEMEKQYRSLILGMRHRAREQAVASARGPRYGLFTTLVGGLGTLIDRLFERLRTAGCEMITNTRVDSVVKAETGGYHLSLADAYRHFDGVVVALPAHAAAKIVKPLDQVMSYKLSTIPYAGVATVNVGLRGNQVPKLPLAAGFVVPAVEGRTLIACTFGHHKYAGRAPEGQALLRGFVGGALHETILERSDGDLVEGVIRDLRDLLGLQGNPLFTTVHRWPKAMAQYVIGHGEGVQVIRGRERNFPGFALVGNGFEGVGIPDLAAQAETAADRITGHNRQLPGAVNDATTRAETA
jgi:protoporphyrinogen/coproporphyrinogen III oxidase